MKINPNFATGSIGLAAIGSLLVAGNAKADMVMLTQGPYAYSDGGEFTATFVGTTSPDVQTFCDEISTEFSPGTTYSYKLVQTDSEGHPLTQGAAYLFSLFNAGILPGYDFDDNGPVSRKTDAGLLQAALWTLQGQTTMPNGDYTTATVANNTFYALAFDHLGAATELANNGLYPVDIMQMYDGTSPAQAQFVPSTVPAPEVPMTHAMVFGAMALAGYSVARLKWKSATKA